MSETITATAKITKRSTMQEELAQEMMHWPKDRPIVYYYRDRRAEHVFRMYGAAAAKNPFSFAHLLAARDFAQRGPLEIILAGDKLGAAALVESVHRAYLPARVLAFAEDVPIGEGRHPVDGRPTAYVCRNRSCDAPVTSAKALVERCAA